MEDSRPIIIDTREGMDMYRLLALRSALKLEVKGIKMTRHSICKIIKDEFGFKGNKQKVLDQFDAHVNAQLEVFEKWKQDTAAERA
jgi:hypothetical protein